MESKILTIGDCGVDVYPEEGYGYMGGMAFNEACKAAAFGSKSAYMGVLGTDYNSNQIRDYAQSVGVDLSHCATEEGECLYVLVKVIDGERHFSVGNRGGVQRLFPLQLKEPIPPRRMLLAIHKKLPVSAAARRFLEILGIKP